MQLTGQNQDARHPYACWEEEVLQERLLAAVFRVTGITVGGRSKHTVVCSELQELHHNRAFLKVQWKPMQLTTSVLERDRSARDLGLCETKPVQHDGWREGAKLTVKKHLDLCSDDHLSMMPPGSR